MIDKIKKLAEKYSPKIIKIRREIHKNPELSFEEFETSKLVHSTLTELKVDSVKKMCKTGVMGLISGKKGKCVALRADLDALPIVEDTNLPFASKNLGKMHACGHDTHSSMLLGAAMILTELKTELNGSVKLIFQPGEEKNPGGASMMIIEGVLDNPKVDAIFGQHILPRKPAGSFGFYPGVMMASQDEIYITIKGKTGHGAKPHLTIDPIVTASQFIVAVQSVVSRNTNPYDPIVITFGKIDGGTATNIIPGEVKIAGTIRTLDEKLRKKALAQIERTLKGICAASGATSEFELSPGYPELKNDENMTKFAEDAAVEFAGRREVFRAERFMGAEDFAYYLKRVPGSFYRIGAGYTTDIHTPTLDVDEAMLAKGAGFMAYLAWKYLSINQ